MMPSGVGGVAIAVPFAHRYGCPMPIGSTLSVLAARVCVPSLRVRQLLLVWSSGLCVSQVGGRGRVGSTALFGAGSGTAYRPRWTRSLSGLLWLLGSLHAHACSTDHAALCPAL